MLADDDVEFLQKNPTAAMITIGEDGIPKAARVAVCLVDGKLWSSGTATRVRTRRLERDPRCTLYVHDASSGWLALETTVTVRRDSSVVDDSVRLFRQLQHKPRGPLSWFGGVYEEDEFRQVMVDEGRVLYEFTVHHTYGMH